jgi:hypothetical protein
MHQPDLFDDTIQARFEAFHSEHPDVYRLFRRFALELAHTGRERGGAKAIMERIRWHFMTSSVGGCDFKINNSFTSRYVRLLVEQEPALAGFFEQRRLRAR